MLKHAFQLVTKIGKIPVFAMPHIAEDIVAKVQKCKKFNDYIDKLNNAQKGVQVEKIELIGVQMFGGDKVGFVTLRAITKKDGFPLPGFVFLRGGAVAVLVVVNGKILLVQQYRVPIQQTMLQAPAGMLDQSGDFTGVAAKEIQEETSIKITHDKLLSLGSYFPSVGGCDEEIQLFYVQIELSEQQIKEVQAKIHGADNEKERIRVKLVENDPELMLKTKDSKLLVMLYAYEHLKKKANL